MAPCPGFDFRTAFGQLKTKGHHLNFLSFRQYSCDAAVVMVLAMLFGMFVANSPVQAQTYPARTIRMVVGSAPGGTSDFQVRLIAQHLGKAWSSPVVVDNRPGGNGTIAVEAVIKAEADGHTLLYVGASITALKALNPGLAYDPLTALVPVGLTFETVAFFVSSGQVPAANVAEFVAHAKRSPGKLNYATIGRNTVALAIEGFRHYAGLDMVEVPFSGEGPYLVALGRNDVQLAIASYVTVAPYFQSGAVRPLMVLGDRRWPALPNVPSASEAGYPNIPSISWYGVMAPVGTSRTTVDKLSAEIRTALGLPETREIAARTAQHILSSTPDEHMARIRRESANWADIMKLANIKPN